MPRHGCTSRDAITNTHCGRDPSPHTVAASAVAVAIGAPPASRAFCIHGTAPPIRSCCCHLLVSRGTAVVGAALGDSTLCPEINGGPTRAWGPSLECRRRMRRLSHSSFILIAHRRRRLDGLIPDRPRCSLLCALQTVRLVPADILAATSCRVAVPPCHSPITRVASQLVRHASSHGQATANHHRSTCSVRGQQ